MVAALPKPTKAANGSRPGVPDPPWAAATGREPQPAATDRPGGLLVRAPLGMIVAARRFPTTVVIATEVDGSAAGAPRMYAPATPGEYRRQ